MKTKVTKKDIKSATTLIESIVPVEGEMRTVNKCGDCGQLFGRRFIPYGIGYGLSINICTCQITAHRPFTTVLELVP